MLAMVIGLLYVQEPSNGGGRFFPCPKMEPSKYAYEQFCAYYSIVWMSVFGAIVIFQWYESWTEAWMYNVVLGALAIPLVFQPFFFETHRPLHQRYATKALIWMSTYTFIGNYWYTHYFYSVLKASYSMPATRLNDVPIAMFFATLFYFSSYHVFSNSLLRYVQTSFQPTHQRTVLFLFLIAFLSYMTAFMESFTISSFPYWSFEDIDMAYTIGSAFYGIYFIVSFPAFYFFDSHIDDDNTNNNHATTNTITLWDSFISSCGHGMIILCLLDFVRLSLNIPLTIGQSNQ